MYTLLVSCLLCLVSSGLYAEQYVCSQPVLSLHKEPREFSEVVAQLVWSDSVQILEQGDYDWAKVVTSNLQEGWVPFSALVLFKDSQYPKPNKVAMVCSRMAYIYIARDLKIPPLFSLPYGAKLELVQALDVQADRWAQVRLINGEVAFVQRSDIVIQPKPLSVNEVLTLAESLIGVPYSWGGNTVYGFDAAGLVQMLYQQMGISLPRDIADQADMPQMRSKSVSELERGDFLFFSLADDGQIDHVGIYLGSGQFLHASSKNTPPSVQVASIKTPYWQASLKKCCQLDRG
jgi:gamma-D-glutamyl-L-lysine dipeptidyl-peptidase